MSTFFAHGRLMLCFCHIYRMLYTFTVQCLDSPKKPFTATNYAVICDKNGILPIVIFWHDFFKQMKCINELFQNSHQIKIFSNIEFSNF